MKVCCLRCGAKAEGTKDQLMELGWAGTEGEINGIKYKFELCPNHYNADAIVHLLSEIVLCKKVTIIRNKEGDYTIDGKVVNNYPPFLW